MERLNDEYLASCPRDRGLILRGHSMTRIETFVDAAFAFALTLLVISIDEIPRSPAQLVETARDIPAFLISALFIGQLWLVHVGWSRIFRIARPRNRDSQPRRRYAGAGLRVSAETHAPIRHFLLLRRLAGSEHHGR